MISEKGDSDWRRVRQRRTQRHKGWMRGRQNVCTNNGARKNKRKVKRVNGNERKGRHTQPNMISALHESSTLIHICLATKS